LKITISWAPNAQKDDLILAASLLFQPWKWFGSDMVRRLEKEFSSYIGQEAVAFDSGRSALYALLKAYDIKEGDEVALQAFTCVALPNPILWTGATPVYIDVDKGNYNLDLNDLEQKLTSKTKAVIVQYTFGICPDIARLKKICESKNILLIEDCCHNLGQKIDIDGKTYNAGTIGDAAIYSFGMEKVISGTRGGMATSKEKKIITKLSNYQLQISKPRFREIIRGILNPLIWKIKENFGKFGKIFSKLMVELKLHEFGLTRLELIGQKAAWLPYQLPNTNAAFVLNQLKKIELFNEHRNQTAASYYNQPLKGFPDKNLISKYAQPIWLRIPVIVEDSEQLLKQAELEQIYLGNWYTEVIHCKDVDLNTMKYQRGSCPNAEWLSTHTINLPTHIGISENEINTIINFLNSTSKN
jgi:perosamine synthetase